MKCCCHGLSPPQCLKKPKKPHPGSSKQIFPRVSSYFSVQTSPRFSRPAATTNSLQEATDFLKRGLTENHRKQRKLKLGLTSWLSWGGKKIQQQQHWACSDTWIHAKFNETLKNHRPNKELPPSAHRTQSRQLSHKTTYLWPSKILMGNKPNSALRSTEHITNCNTLHLSALS